LGEDGTVGSIDDWLSEPRYTYTSTNELRLIPYSFKHRSGAVYHFGEVQDLLGELDYRVRIMIDLAKVPDYVYEIVIGAGIYGGRQRKQTFGRVVDAFARFHQDDGESLRFSLANDPSSKATNMVFLRFYRQTKRGGILGPWAVKAVGEGSDGGIKGLLQSFGIEAEEEMV
jgi:stress response protein SCP2